MYDVPLRTGQLPLLTEDAHLAFKNVNVTLLDRPIPTRKFAPYVQVNDQSSSTAIMARTPLISCTDRLNVQFGHSLFFVKRSQLLLDYNIKILITAKI